MFTKTEYKLLISPYMTKQKYKELIEKYMIKFNLPYATVKQLICREQIKKFEHENKIAYEKAFIDTYNDIVENGYNISML
jgi:hypothetical protein